ncbi:ABC transporter permease [Enterococcus faecium]|uniref:ABC transporter permease n=1 Tax=Enterococcus faecium TaxID=1352 RepID=UPI002543E771|nr:ABC transporter permease [Enterococcus faecium]MDK4372969.1 ABC transporter permease [Enterococcus faecium]
MSLLTFERNLLLKNKVNFLFPLLLVVLFAFPLFFDHKLAYTEFDELNHNYEEMQRLIETLKEDENEKEFVESLEKSNKLIEAILHAKNTGNVQQMVEATYHYEKDILDRLISGQRQGIPIIEQQKRVELLRYMKEHQIQRYSIFDLPAHLPLANYYENIFSGMISSFLILCITALFLSSIISYEKRKQVISLVNLLPDSMVKKHSIRFTIYYGAAMLSLVMPFLIVSILVIIKNGLGDFRYPVGTIIGQEIRILPMYEYLFQSFLFLLLWVLFLSTISFLLSALFEHSLVNLLGTLLCLFLAEYRLFSSIGWIESISHYLPTSYVDFQNVIIGEDIFSPLASEQVTFMNGILTLGIWSIVLLFIGMGTIYIKKSY